MMSIGTWQLLSDPMQGFLTNTINSRSLKPWPRKAWGSSPYPATVQGVKSEETRQGHGISNRQKTEAVTGTEGRPILQEEQVLAHPTKVLVRDHRGPSTWPKQSGCLLLADCHGPEPGAQTGAQTSLRAGEQTTITMEEKIYQKANLSIVGALTAWTFW